MDIEKDINFHKVNRLCCMCSSPQVFIIDIKTEEFLCKECSDLNEEIYGTRRR